MSERHIDDAIDAAVRDLMNVDTDPAFRARVVERLRRPRPRSGLWRQLSIAAATLAVVFAVMVARRGGDTADPPRIATAPAPVATPAPQAATPAPGVLTPRVPALPRGRRAVVREATHGIVRGSLVAASADRVSDGPATGLEPLERIESIAMPSIAPSPIVTPEMTIAPIAPMNEIAIAPLDRQPQRN